MANAVVAAWTACIKELQQVVEATGAVTPAHTVAIHGLVQRLHKLEAQQPLPHTAWKKLAQEVQVKAAIIAAAQAAAAAAAAAAWMPALLLYEALTEGHASGFTNNSCAPQSCCQQLVV
jgi:hypothetical protein